MTKRKNKHAAALGRIGGPARAQSLTPERRSEIARMGGIARKLVLDAKRKTA